VTSSSIPHGKNRGADSGADGWPAAALAGGPGRGGEREVGESREEVEGDRFPCLPRAEMVQRGRSMGGGRLRQWRWRCELGREGKLAGELCCGGGRRRQCGGEGGRPAGGWHRRARKSSAMAVTVRHGAAQGCRRQCVRGGGAEATAALTPAARGSRGEAGEAARRAVPRRRAHRGEGPGC
jgi:hypothetical protein